MKVQPVAHPSAIKQPTSNETAKRSAAIAAFNTGAQPPQQVVQSQNAVSVEELGAIKPKTVQISNITEETQEAVETTLPVEASTEETTTTEAPVEKTQEQTAISRQFAQLARQEKALRAKVQQQEQTIKAREQALAAREAELTAKDSQYKTGYISEQDLKSDTLRTLARAGVPLDDFMQQLVNQTQSPVDPRTEAMVSRLEAKIKSLEDAAESSQKSYKEQQSQAYQAAVRQIETDAKSLVNSDPAFEMIKATSNVREVVNLITATYEKDGVLLTVEEAAQQVEDYLVDEAVKVTRVDKIKKRLAAASTAATKPKAESNTPASKPAQQQPMKTLTNASSSSRQLSARERALLAFKGELK